MRSPRAAPNLRAAAEIPAKPESPACGNGSGTWLLDRSTDRYPISPAAAAAAAVSFTSSRVPLAWNSGSMNGKIRNRHMM